MELLWKCAAIAVSAAALGLALKPKNGELTLLLGLLAAVLILIGTLTALEPAAELLRKLEEKSGLRADLIIPVLKSVGLSILGKLTENACRDAGQSAAASAMELASSGAILCAAMPLLEDLADTVFSLL